MIFQEIKELIVYYLKHGNDFAKHDCFNVFKKAIKDCESAGFPGLKNKMVLDLGCGQRFPFALQCAAAGSNVTALDLNYVKPDTLPIAFVRMVRYNGLKRSCKSLLRRILFDKKYYNTLSKAYGEFLVPYIPKINFVISDLLSKNYPLPSGCYDLIASNAVVEHVETVFQFAKEISRLLKKEGYFYAIIHNFYSLSGGHNLDWAFPDENPPKHVPPWDHLRETRFPSWVSLNRLTPKEYKGAFSEYLEILHFSGRDINHDRGGIEGEQFLIPEIEAKLSEYSREMLLTRSWCIICRKK